MKKSTKVLIGLGVFIVFVILIKQVVSEGAKTEMQTIENQVAKDAVDQYNIAARQGDQMQMYTQAGLVCAAYLQAKDEPNYRIWKKTEDSLAKKVGLAQ